MYYSELAEVYKELESASKRLEKTFTIYKLFRDKKIDEIKLLIYLVEGRVFPKWDERKIGFSSKLIVKALNNATGTNTEQIEKLWAEKGDLGLVAEVLVLKKNQTTLFHNKLTTEKVYSNIRDLASLQGQGSVGRKVALVSELITNASPLESKYVVRTVLELLRVGVAEGIIRDAIAWMFFPKVIDIFVPCKNCKELVPKQSYCVNCKKDLVVDNLDLFVKRNCKLASFEKVLEIKGARCVYAKNYEEARKIYNYYIDKVQDLFNLTNDFVKVMEALSDKEIVVKLDPGIPINPMLAIKVESISDAFKELGRPLLAEEKLDGFRLQIHQYGKETKLFTRRLENVTNQFKELINIINENVKAKSFILDTEVIGYDPKTFRHLPFQSISQRIKRKYDIEKTSKDIPVQIYVFDILYKDGKSLLHLSQKERREIIEKIILTKKGKISVTKKLITSDEKELEKFYKESLAIGNEGLMLKNLAKPYTPGRRVKGWLKLKPVLEPLDLVIVGATTGEGKRANYLSSFRLACFDAKSKKYLECGMASSGIKEKDMEEGINIETINKLIEPLIIKKHGRDVDIKPKIIVEVKYEEIQKSPTYAAGYALRFPSLVVIRYDKPLKDINTLADIQKIYNSQRGRKF